VFNSWRSRLTHPRAALPDRDVLRLDLSDGTVMEWKLVALTGIGITLGAVAVAAAVSAIGEPTGESVSELSGAVRQ
jgi:hypothetical protein